MRFKDSQYRQIKDDFFELSGLFESGELKHHPFIVFNEDGDDVTVELCSSARELLVYDPKTIVLGQWSGNWSSDWFKFTVADYMTWKARK
jgi:hypothetical protein